MDRDRHERLRNEEPTRRRDVCPFAEPQDKSVLEDFESTDCDLRFETRASRSACA